MKTSIKLVLLLIGLILAVSAWAQEQSQDQGQEAADTATAETAEVAASTDEPLADEAAEQATGEIEQESGEVAEGQTTGESTEQAIDEGGDETAEVSEPEIAAEADTEQTTESGEARDGEQAAVETQPAEARAAPAPVDETTGDAAETFVFQGHPIFTPDTAELVYRPLVNYLNDSLPYRFDLELAPDYHRYWLGIRRGENPHLVLEEPHLAAFRMTRYDFTPLVHAAEPLTYSMLASMDNAEASAQDFIGRPVSSMPAPSLGYLILANWYDNPMQQPIIQSNASSWMDAVEIVFSMEADAAIVPNNLVSRYVNMANVLTSQEFPGVTISASPAIPDEIQREIRDALLALHEDENHFAALNELDISQFVEARPEEYEGLEEWLGLVYPTL